MKLNTEKCRQWAEERGLLGENPKTDKQLQKLSSECNEFNDELNKGNLDKAFLEFGDVLVTMIIYCAQRKIDFQNVFENATKWNSGDGLILLEYIGDAANNERNDHMEVQSATLSRILAICEFLAPQFDPQRALDLAVEKISNRKTFMKNGTVVKEEDFTDKERKQLGNMS